MSPLVPILESLLDTFPGLAYRCRNDAKWTMQYVSSGAARLTGYAAHALVGNRDIAYADLIHFEDRARVQDEIALSLTSQSGYVVEYRIVTAGGAVKHVIEHGNAIRDDDGRILALQGFVSDVTAERQLRREVADMTERFRWIAQATNDHIWDWNLQSGELWHGKDERHVFGLPSDESRSGLACWSDLIHADDRDDVLGSLERAIATTDRDWSAEYRMRRRDGTYAQVLDRGFIIRDAGGTALRVVGGVSDLTERNRSRRHLERLSRALRILSQCNERLVRIRDKQSLLSEICELIVKAGDYQGALVSLAGGGAGPVLRHAASYCTDYGKRMYGDIRFTAMTEPASPACVAMTEGRPVICNDIDNDPAIAPWRHELVKRGHRSGLWLPLAHGGQRLGAISIHCRTRARFDLEEIELLQTLANNIAFGIVNIGIREERSRIETAAVRIAAGVSASTGEAFFSQLAHNMGQAVGADGAFVARFADGAPQSATTITAVVDGAVVPNFDYAIAGAPCERLLRSTACVVIDDVATCFPQSGAARMGMAANAGCRLDSAAGTPLGMLFVLFRGPVAQTNFVTQTIQVFAARAGAELERQLADARIREQASLLDKAKDAIVVHDASDRVTFWNKGADRLYGLSAPQVLGTAVNEVVYNDPAHFEAMRQSLARHGEWQGEVACRRQDGTELALEINVTLVRNAAGQPCSVLSIITDITRRKAAEHEVAQLAFYDRLTGLPNRHFLETQLQQFLQAGAAAGNEGALLWMDLDGLKSLNDTRGHDVGDVLLQQTGARIALAIGPADVAARFGGDEFVVLVKNVQGQPDKAVTLAQDLLRRLNEPFALHAHTHVGSASIGVAYFRCGHDAAPEILKHADIAMYEAKAAGRNTLRIFGTQMKQVADLRAGLESDLRRALQDGALYLVYQPQVGDDGHVAGVEALLRWDHPTRGPVSPAAFIPVAEACGLITACGEWVLHEACQQLRRWEGDPATSALSIAVNVSARQLQHPDFVGQVREVLGRTGADPRKLKLELTESSLVTEPEATVEKMKALKAVGISFSLDDFGTGFSSLSYLRRLPLDQLKIDRSFVCDVVTDTNAAVIMRSIIALGQSLSLDVIAEGVETPCQRRVLALHGCRTYQGYLYSRPVRIEALEAFLRHARGAVTQCLASAAAGPVPALETTQAEAA
jgi:diguanylate cyclase (GGDEF)-like protein/PAS domain S-box-containing protein